MPHRRCRKSSAIFLCGVMTIFLWHSATYPVQGHSGKAVNSGVAKVKVEMFFSPGENQVVIQKGETLWGLARRYKTTVAEIVRLNNITDPNKIKAGQKLLIKSSADTGQSAPQNLTLDVQTTPKDLEVKVLNVATVDILVEDLAVGTDLKEFNGRRGETKTLSDKISPHTLALQPESSVPVQLFEVREKESEISQAEKNVQMMYNPAKEGIQVSGSSRGFGPVSKEDLDLLARIIYAEARGEDFEGQVAVGAVVLNRLKDPRFPKSIRGVIFQPGAFTAVNDKQIYLTPDEEAYRAAEAALSGRDPTGGAIYYYNPLTATDRWIKNRPVIKRIGNHTFSI